MTSPTPRDAAAAQLPPPKAAPAAGWLGLLVALLLIGLGVVLGQEALFRWNVLGTSWLGSFLASLDGLHAGTWTLPAGVLVALVGLLLLVGALKPRRRTHARIDGDGDLWMSPAALGALARDAAEGVSGVARVAVTVSPTTVRVRAAAEHPEDVAGTVEQAVQDRLAGADVKVSVRTARHRSEGAA